MKKVCLFAVLLMALMMLLAGCYNAEVDSETIISSKEGAGRRTFVVRIWHDDAVNPEEPANTVSNNSLYMPKGIQGVADKIKSSSPIEDLHVSVQMNASADYDQITWSFDFDTIEDYNAKAQALAAASGQEIAPASISVDGDTVTFEEASGNFSKCVAWAVQAIFDDPEVFDPRQGDPAATPVGIEDIYQLFSASVTIGDQSASVSFNTEGEPEDIIRVSGVPGELPPEPTSQETTPATEKPTQASTTSQSGTKDTRPLTTSDDEDTDEGGFPVVPVIIIVIVVVIAAALVVSVVVKKRKGTGEAKD